MEKVTLVTGASSGIGTATAREMARLNHSLILCGRRQERLDALKSELDSTVNVRTLRFNVGNHNEVEEAINSLPDEWKTIDYLVNNAGNAHGLAPLHEGDINDWEAMIDSNVKGVLYLTRLVAPQMVERKQGHIINIGSLAGKEVYPNGNVYCATKFALDALTQGMRLDFNKHKIKVSAINPGLVETEFSKVRYKGDEDQANTVYQGYEPLTPEDIAEIIGFVVSRPRHVNIADMLVLPTAQAASKTVLKE